MSACDAKCWASVDCKRCGMRKAVRGRSLPIEVSMSRCSYYCPGYDEEPKAPHLFSEHDSTRFYTDPDGWKAHEEECPQCAAVNANTHRDPVPMLIDRGDTMVSMFKTGFVLLAIGGAFWAGERHERKAVSHEPSGCGTHDDTVAIKAAIAAAIPSRFVSVSPEQGVIGERRTFISDGEKWYEVNRYTDNTAAALRDCNDAMYMWIRALEQRAGGWDDSRQLPGFRYLNPEGEVVTYHVPPPRKRTGSIFMGPNTVHREAGYVAPLRVNGIIY